MLHGFGRRRPRFGGDQADDGKAMKVATPKVVPHATNLLVVVGWSMRSVRSVNEWSFAGPTLDALSRMTSDGLGCHLLFHKKSSASLMAAINSHRIEG